MNTVTELIFVRHGESLGNAGKVMIGQTDVDLSPRGLEQAIATARALENRQINAVYSSDLVRAIHTAEPHAKRRGLAVIVDSGLREVNLGDWENKKMDELRQNYGESFSRYWNEDFGISEFLGGESIQGACERFYSTVLKIARDNAGGRVLIVAHAAVIRAFWGRISDIAPEKVGTAIPFPANASYSTVKYENGEFVPVEFSAAAHLLDIGFINPANVR